MRTVLVLSMLIGTAHAQDRSAVDVATHEARRALEDGDLVTANTALDRALAAETIEPSQLASLLELRAILAYADDRLGLLEESLFGLAILGTDAPTAFPPPLRARYQEIVASHPTIALRAELVASQQNGHRVVRVVPVASGDAGHLVRALRVNAAAGDGPLAPVEASTELDAGDPHRRVEIRYTIEARGPGGALLASLGTSADPAVGSLAALPVDETGFHVAIVTAIAVAVLGAIAFTYAWLATDGFTAGQPTVLVPPRCTGDSCAAVGALLSF